MKRSLPKVLALSLCLSLFCLLAGEAYSFPKEQKGFRKIAKEELKALIETSGRVIIDVRTDRQWEASEEKIKGAVREDPFEEDVWSKKYSKERPIVLYCS